MAIGATRFSIRLKLLSSAALVLLPISALIYFYFPQREEDIALAAIASRTTNMAEFVALGVGRGLHSNDFSDVVSAIAWVKEDPTLAYVVVIDSAGEVFASHNPGKVALSLATDAPARVVRNTGQRLDISVPIKFEAQRQGTLFLGVSLSEMHRQIDGERRLALGISLVVFLLGAAASRFFAHLITRPLLTLREAAVSVAHGNYEVAIPQGGNDEVGALADGFGTMVGNLKESTERLNQTVVDLAAARDAAQASERAKAYFLATMSHEIRTPMNGVMGMLELLGGTELAPRQRRFTETAFRSAETLLDVINSILDFSKIEAGHMELHRTGFDLRQAVEDVCEMLAPQAHQKGIDLIVRIAPDLHHNVHGDVMRVRQVLVNLLGNAIKFTDTGAVQVRVMAGTLSGQTQLVRVEVQDSGIGVAPDAVTNLFNPFIQADATTTRRFGGTGLGLAIARQLVELMGGEIGVESQVGVGSTFWFTVVLDLRPLNTSAVRTPAQTLRGRRILVIDDNAVNREVLREQLGAWGVLVDEAENGADALERLRRQASQPYDALILDFTMPEMDGGEVARRIRSNPAWATVPILLLSSVGRSSQSQESAAPVNAILTKPARQRELAERLSMLVKGHADSRPGNAALALQRGRDPGAAGAMTGRFRGLRVLLAEDNPVNQCVAVGFLEEFGCAVVVAATGRDAVREATSQTFDLILMDCMMPELDGYEAAQVIRAHANPAVNRLPIIALTASVLDGERQKCLAAGMSDYLAKPFHLEELTAVLQHWGRVPPAASSGRALDSAAAAATASDPALALDAGALDIIRYFAGGRPTVV